MSILLFHKQILVDSPGCLSPLSKWIAYQKHTCSTSIYILDSIELCTIQLQYLLIHVFLVSVNKKMIIPCMKSKMYKTLPQYFFQIPHALPRVIICIYHSLPQFAMFINILYHSPIVYNMLTYAFSMIYYTLLFYYG